MPLRRKKKRMAAYKRRLRRRRQDALRSERRSSNAAAADAPARYPCGIVFTGHMIDLPGRATPRFPPELEADVGAAIEAAVVRLQASAGGDVVAFSGAARGADILFIEACERLSVPVFVVLPFSRPTYARTSVVGVESGDWLRRYEDALRRLGPDRVEELGLEESDEAHVRGNDRLLERAEAVSSKVVLLAVLERDATKKTGGAAHFVHQVERAGGHLELIELDDGKLKGGR